LFQKGEDIFVIKNKEKGGLEICKESVEEGVHLTIKITIDITGVLCPKEGWKEEDSARL